MTVAVFVDFGGGSFKLGVPILNIQETEENGELNDVFDVEVNEERNDKKQLIGIKFLNDLLKENNLETMPFRDLKNFIAKHLTEENLVLFKFGQKQSLVDFIEMQWEILLGADVEFAMAVEMQVDVDLLYRRKGKCYFPRKKIEISTKNLFLNCSRQMPVISL